MKASVVFFILLFAVGLTFTDSVAMERLFTVDEVVKSADVIFIGKAVGQSSRYTPNHKMILTDVDFEILKLINTKNSGPGMGKSVTLTFAGGKVDEKIIRVSDVPDIVVGEEYVIFSRMDGMTYASPVIGSFQGLFYIMKDDITGVSYPLTYGSKMPISSINPEHHLVLGPSVSRIANGRGERASESDSRGYLEVAPQPVISADKASGIRQRPGVPSTGANAGFVPTAVVKPLLSPMPDHIMTIDEFIEEINRRI